MGKSKFAKRYPPQFHRQMVELVRAGRKISELSREFGCSQWAISRWVKQADRDEGRGDGGLTTAEREELTKLRRENRQLKREILSKAAAWLQQWLRTSVSRSGDWRTSRTATLYSRSRSTAAWPKGSGAPCRRAPPSSASSPARTDEHAVVLTAVFVCYARGATVINIPRPTSSGGSQIV